MFAFTSPYAKMDSCFNNGKDPPHTFHIQGQSCHMIGSMLPMSSQTPKLMQLYIYDTGTKIQNRIKGIKYVL